MNVREELARIIAGDPRYSIDAYAFILQSLDLAGHQKAKGQDQKHDGASDADAKQRSKASAARSIRTRPRGHVSGRELCEAVRKLALRQYGLLAATVLNHWGVHSTSDIGDVVYNLITAGDLEKTPADARSDFDNVFDFDRTLRPRSPLADEDLG
jgi:uncharacterized repeat protein (TIGR04138 family)